jgi:sugar transferase EpsL
MRRGLFAAAKRTSDLIGAGLLLAVTFPLLIIVSLLVRARLGSPVLFHQVQPGLDGQLFTMLKFRTMSVGHGPDAERFDQLRQLVQTRGTQEPT